MWRSGYNQARMAEVKKQFEDQRSQNELLVKELNKAKDAQHRSAKELKRSQSKFSPQILL